MLKLWKWIWSERYTETPECYACGERRVHRSRMFYVQDEGYFCNEKSYNEYWLMRQT